MKEVLFLSKLSFVIRAEREDSIRLFTSSSAYNLRCRAVIHLITPGHFFFSFDSVNIEKVPPTFFVLQQRRAGER
jgi:hypothetical protein